MSEVEQLFGNVQAAHAGIEDAQKNNAAALDLAARITTAGAAMGFGNDTSLILAAKTELETASGAISAATGSFDTALRVIAQAKA